MLLIGFMSQSNNRTVIKYICILASAAVILVPLGCYVFPYVEVIVWGATYPSVRKGDGNKEISNIVHTISFDKQFPFNEYQQDAKAPILIAYNLPKVGGLLSFLNHDRIFIYGITSESKQREIIGKIQELGANIHKVKVEILFYGPREYKPFNSSGGITNFSYIEPHFLRKTNVTIGTQ